MFSVFLAVLDLGIYDHTCYIIGTNLEPDEIPDYNVSR